MLVFTIYSLNTVFQLKNQINEMTEILKEIKNGNGNRRILAKTQDFIAPLAFEINDIIISYEEKLSDFHQTEETNRQLMTSLSHDVRTPLTTLIGYLSAIQKGGYTQQDYDKYLETACRKANDLKNYINHLFDWFKLNSNDYASHMENIEIAEFTTNILIDWISIFEEKQIEYMIDMKNPPYWVKLDMDGFIRVLNNLLQNIVLHSSADKVQITLFKQNEQIKLIISDNGVGIAQNDLKHIFERLYTGSKDGSYKGSGLGLSIVYKIIEKMNGTITVESTLGKHTTFTLIFPLVK